MIRCVINLLMLLSCHHISEIKSTKAIEQRIEILKRKISAEIQHDRIFPPEDHRTTKPTDYYDYLVMKPDHEPIKPIIQYPDKKKHKKHKHRLMTAVNATITTVQSTKKAITQETTRVHNNFSYFTPAGQRFRRAFVFEEDKHKPQKWMHCLNFISTYVKGYKENMPNGFKEVTMKDPQVIRITQLLNFNTTESTRSEINSVLFQISNMRLRLYEWNIDAITTLLNSIITVPIHSFRTLKRGLKELFTKWDLNTENTTRILTQTRIFRPPCIKVSEFAGSTKPPKPATYSAVTKKNTNSDDDCDD